MKRPICELCGKPHYSYEAHIVTKVVPVTKSVTKLPLRESVTKVGRPRKHGSNAERQAAYRRRRGT